MEFYNINKPENSLYHDSLNFAGITDTSQFPIVEFTRNANNWYRKTDSWIWEATGAWEYDDSNHTDLPIVTTTLVTTPGSEQQDYALSSSARKIDRVEVLDSNGNYQPVIPFDKSMVKGVAMSEFYETPGLPKYYDLVGNSIFLYPKPGATYVTEAKGLKLYIGRDIKEMTITDTNTEPGFDNHYHRIISLGAAYDHLLAIGAGDSEPVKIKGVRAEISQLHNELNKHYSSRHRDLKLRIRPVDTDGF